MRPHLYFHFHLLCLPHCWVGCELCKEAHSHKLGLRSSAKFATLSPEDFTRVRLGRTRGWRLSKIPPQRANQGGAQPADAPPATDKTHEQGVSPPEWLTRPSSVVFSGALKKKSETTILGRHTWNVRFFVLFQHTGILSYWVNKNDFAKGIPARGAISVDRIVKVDLLDPKKRRFNLAMEQGSHTYMLQATTPVEFDSWVKHLQDYPKGSLKTLAPEEQGVRKSYDALELYGVCRELAATPFAVRFTPAQLRSLASFLTPHTYAQGESIFKPDVGGSASQTPTAVPRQSSQSVSKDEWKQPVRQASHTLDRTQRTAKHAVFYQIVNGDVALSAIDPTQDLNKLSVLTYRRGAKECVDASSLHGHMRLVRGVVAPSSNSCSTLQMSSSDLEEFLRAADPKLAQFTRTALGYEVTNVLTNVQLFNGCRPELLQALGCMFRHVALSEGEVLFKEGSPGARMYILVSGECKGSVRMADGTERVLHRYVANETIALNSLVLEMPRTMTVTATSDAVLMEMREAEWAQLWNMLPPWTQKTISVFVKEETVLSFKRYNVPFFMAIPEPKMTVLASLCMLTIHEAGFVIAKQGEVGDKFFLLAHGACSVTKHVEGESKEMEVGRLASGSYFGEIALVRESPRLATVTCTTRCVLLSISQENFNKFFLEAPEAIAEFEVKLARADVSLRSVLYHPVGLKQLETFLKEEHSEENLIFWKTCRAYREMKEHHLIASNVDVAKNRMEVLATAKKIYDQYCDEAAVDQVNLKFDRRSELKRRIDRAEANPATEFLTEAALDECSDEIQLLLKSDTFPRFKRSLAFMSFLEQVQSYEHIDATQLLKPKA